MAELESLYRERYPVFLRVAPATVRDEGAAADSVHDAFVQAVRNRRSFRGEGALEGLVWRMVVNAARKQRRDLPEAAAVERDEPADASQNGFGDPVRAAVAALPERQRLRDAGARRRPALLRPVAGVVAAAAALFALALFQPWDGESPTVLERALAAVDDGPVLHVVLRDEAEGAVIDLESGQRTPLYREREVWFDEARGLREVTRFGGVVQRDLFYPPPRVSSELFKTYAGLASGYREALKNGDARVLGQGEIDGIPVHWIQTERYVLFDPDGTRHVWQRVVAVSQETFEPVYVDEKADGEFGPQTGARIRSVEWLPADEGDFRSHGANPPFGGFEIRDGKKGPDELAALLGRKPLWLGEDLLGIPLEASGSAGTSAVPEVSMFYGSRFAHGRAKGTPDLRRFVVLKQTPDLAAFPRWVAEFFRPGVVVVLERQGFVQRDGLYVVIAAPTEELILAAARALEPMPG